MPFIKIIEPDEAEGELQSIYEELVQKRGKIARVHKIQSLNPESIRRHMDLYMTLLFGKSPLRRYQREMIAVVVSAANNCEYCELHHGEALNHFWKDEQRVEALRRDYTSLNLDKKDEVICRLARKLTETPSDIRQDDIDLLKQQGLSDRAILDATLIISYFNFVNRIVMGLGVEADQSEVKGYNYE